MRLLRSVLAAVLALAAASFVAPPAQARSSGYALVADTDPAVAHAAAARSHGGWITAERLTLERRLIAASKASGHWDRTDDIALLVAQNPGAELTTLKRRVLMTAVAAPPFTADRGYVFNGTTQYVDTGFVPSTMAVKMTLC